MGYWLVVRICRGGRIADELLVSGTQTFAPFALKKTPPTKND